MKTPNGEMKNLEEAMEREARAASAAATALLSVRSSIERMDAPGHRSDLSGLKSAFDELTRSASERNLFAGKLAVALGLRRELTVEALIEALGGAGDRLRERAGELRRELDRVRANISVLALLTRYGTAMTASLIAIRGQGTQPAPYGRNGHRTANYTRVGRLA